MSLIGNNLKDEGMEFLCEGLKNPNARVQSLWLVVPGFLHCFLFGVQITHVIRNPISQDDPIAGHKQLGLNPSSKTSYMTL